MFRKMTLVVLALAVLSFVSSVQAGTGCKKFNFIGTFTRLQPPSDVFGDGSANHTYIFQLQLHSDGTATQLWSGSPDFMINLGTTTNYRGSWQCRADGNLVVTVLEGLYTPVNSSRNPNAVVPDVQLVGYSRVTYLFSVDSDNTLTRLQARARTYGENEDPTNPTGGSLQPLSTTQVTYTRFVASDADLNLP
jgi:hypothetical protein